MFSEITQTVADTKESHSAKKVEPKVYKYGNYKGYYYKRNSTSATDIRLEMFKDHQELFRDQKILDIGCNSGFITINIAKKFSTKSAVGIDIDAELIGAYTVLMC